MRAVNHFLLPDLHVECLCMARCCLSVLNVLLLLVAEKHGQKELKEAALEFVAANHERMRAQLS